MLCIDEKTHKALHKYQCAMVNIFFTFKYEHEALTTSAEYRHERQRSTIKFRNYVILFVNITLQHVFEIHFVGVRE